MPFLIIISKRTQYLSRHNSTVEPHFKTTPIMRLFLKVINNKMSGPNGEVLLYSETYTKSITSPTSKVTWLKIEDSFLCCFRIYFRSVTSITTWGLSSLKTVSLVSYQKSSSRKKHDSREIMSSQRESNLEVSFFAVVSLYSDDFTSLFTVKSQSSNYVNPMCSSIAEYILSDKQSHVTHNTFSFNYCHKKHKVIR